jgi:hypothetical protein
LKRYFQIAKIIEKSHGTGNNIKDFDEFEVFIKSHHEIYK